MRMVHRKEGEKRLGTLSVAQTTLSDLRIWLFDSDLCTWFNVDKQGRVVQEVIQFGILTIDDAFISECRDSWHWAFVVEKDNACTSVYTDG